MTYSQKYGRTFHFPFSPGVTNDDRVNDSYWDDINAIKKIVLTEKLDGENNCLNKHGVFARSHGAPAASPWTSSLRQKWDLIKFDLGDYEIFGENLYAIHSIEYLGLDSHFYVFAVRELGQWLSWEESVFVAAAFDLPMVPLIETIDILESQKAFEKKITVLAASQSAFQSVDAKSGDPCTMEGIVARNFASYATSDFEKNVFKYVRLNHVATDEHWTRKWKRSPLKNERK